MAALKASVEAAGKQREAKAARSDGTGERARAG